MFFKLHISFIEQLILTLQLQFLLSLFAPWEFFTSALTDGLSLEIEWQQVSSSHQDPS